MKEKKENEATAKVININDSINNAKKDGGFEAMTDEKFADWLKRAGLKNAQEAVGRTWDVAFDAGYEASFEEAYDKGYNLGWNESLQYQKGFAAGREAGQNPDRYICDDCRNEKKED